MGQAILDGFERGFNMMERHKARLGSEDRLSRLDKQNESRYQDSQQRLSDIDEKNDARYKDTLAYREKQMQSQADYRNQSTEATKEYRNWQKSKQEKDTLWAKDQQMLGVGWQYFRENGQVAPEHEEMFQRNQGYDPRTLQKPEMRANIKALSGKMQEVIKSGKMSEVNNPENVKLFNSVFKDKFASSIGTTDPVTGKVIKDVDFTGFVPVEDDKEHRVSFALKVTYEDGTVKIKPKTKGGTTEEDDPVLTMKPDELMATVKAKVMMADMIERPEYWDKMGESVSNNLIKGRPSGINQEDKTQAAYRKELSSIDKDLTNAITKIQGDSAYNYEPEAKAKAIADVKATFEQRKNALNESYGLKKEEKAAKEQPSKAKEYKSTVDGHDVDGVVERFMKANKGMTKEQALTAAMQQGYISE